MSKKKLDLVTVAEAAEIIKTNPVYIRTLIYQGKLTVASRERPMKLYKSEVERYADEKRERDRKQQEKKLYPGYTFGPNLDIRVILDPDDHSGLAHVWFISKAAFDDLMTGQRKWKDIPASEIYQESICGKLPEVKPHGN